MTLTITKANNPCALRPHPGEGWLGSRGVVRTQGGYYQSFSSMAWGWRAALRNLHTYRIKHGLRTSREIISRWAPPSDNNPTAVYVANVARWCGVAPDEPIPFDYAGNQALILAIARQESGVRQGGAALARAFALMAEEERRAGRDPAPYLPPVLARPVERAASEARRGGRRVWAGLAASATAAIGWLQSRIAHACAWAWAECQQAADALKDLDLRMWAALALGALALLLFFTMLTESQDDDPAGGLDPENDPSPRNRARSPRTGRDAGRREPALRTRALWRV